uniref:Isochorismatase-like domain-containing protein n=1 Tax=Amphora coffeiformis TaxID=265554 RepID=A0A7S3L5M0_9STRA|mmetsp:Transcript_4656/g.8865  ORF Transcript_4656/g.8865 Transcript_4656/m.8865 type:complete len:427 (+) Transcript_4656:174-1454(+)|eukprot:scaffold586_cov155-Amphora_coffeaeformis.AAC.11
MSLAKRVVPGVSTRGDFPVVGARSALLVIDVQKHTSLPHSEEGAAQNPYFFNEACPAAVENIAKLVESFRIVRDESKNGSEVIWTYLQSATRDGRDISLDYKLSGPDLANIPGPQTDRTDIFLPHLQPDLARGKGDILLPKTSCNVFVSTNVDYMLRNLHVEQLVIVGQLTDECVESAVRSAADSGYLVTVVEDACASLTSEKHAKGLDGVKGFARIVSTSQMLDEVVEGLSSQVNEGSVAANSSVGFQDGLNDDTVVSYLRLRGLHKVARQLDMMLSIQAIAKGEKREHPSRRRDDDKKESRRRSPSRKSKQRNGSLRHVSSPGSGSPTKSDKKKVGGSDHSPKPESKETIENQTSAEVTKSPTPKEDPPTGAVLKSPIPTLPAPPLEGEKSPTKTPSRRSRSRSKTRLSVRGSAGEEEARLDNV